MINGGKDSFFIGRFPFLIFHLIKGIVVLGPQASPPARVVKNQGRLIN